MTVDQLSCCQSLDAHWCTETRAWREARRDEEKTLHEARDLVSRISGP